MMDACLMAGADYLDITGEIDVIEWAVARSERRKQAGVALIPAVGFDVVPSDCLAKLLSQRLPEARVLQLAFSATGGLSPGTAKTMVEAIPGGGRVRIDGEIRHVPVAWKTMEIPFRHRKQWGMTIPWGDVASAYYSTGIPNIEVYTSTSPRRIANCAGSDSCCRRWPGDRCNRWPNDKSSTACEGHRTTIAKRHARRCGAVSAMITGEVCRPRWKHSADISSQPSRP